MTPASYMLALASLVTVAIWMRSVDRGVGRRASDGQGSWVLEVMLYGVPLVTLAGTIANTTGDELAVVVQRSVTVVAAVCGVLALLSSVLDRRRGADGLLVAAIAYSLSVGLSSALGVIPSLPVNYLFTPLLLAPFLLHRGYTSEWLLVAGSRVVRMFAGLSLLAVLVWPFAFFDDGRRFFGLARLAGIAEHPNGLAAVLAVGVALEFSRESRWWWKSLVVLPLVMTQSTTGLLSAGLALIVIRACRKGHVVWMFWLGGAVLMIVSVIAPESLDLIFGDATENLGTLNGRMRVWEAAMKGFALNPIFGYGPQLFNENYRFMYIGGAEFATHAHNQVVQSLAEAGLIGLLGLVILIVALIKRAVRLRYVESGVVLAMVTVVLCRFVTETPLKPSGYAAPWLLLALLVGLASAQEAGAVTQVASVRGMRGTVLARREDARVGD